VNCPTCGQRRNKLGWELDLERRQLRERLSEALRRVPEWCMEEDGTVSCHFCYLRQDQGHAEDCARAVLASQKPVCSCDDPECEYFDSSQKEEQE